MSNPKRRMLVITGDGKGKTTAALGLMLRASGHGLRVLMVQFVKSDASTGEFAAAKNLPGVKMIVGGKGFVPPPQNPKFAEHAAAAQDSLKLVQEALAQKSCDVLILDEVCVAIKMKLLAEESVLETIRQAPDGIALVLTGRGATPALIEMADTVSEIQNVKHGMSAGIPAQKGIES